MMEPEELVLSSVEVTLAMAKLVVVAKLKSELPRSVVEPRRLEATELKAPPMVVEAVIEREPVVVPLPREKLLPVMRPVLEMENSVEMSPLLEVEAMANIDLSADEEAACTARVANGVEEPVAIVPVAVILETFWILPAKYALPATLSKELGEVVPSPSEWLAVKTEPSVPLVV